MTLFKSLLHNIGVVLVGLAIACLGARLDPLIGLREFRSPWATAAAALLLSLGFLIRAWATFLFYEQKMKVISLVPQKKLITTGPFRFSRNPLYLGGNGFIFFGAALMYGSPAALLLTALHLPLIDLFIRWEERQLEQSFGEDWVRYKKQVPRWI